MKRRDFLKHLSAILALTILPKKAFSTTKNTKGGKKMNSKILVIYYSWGGNTRSVANKINNKVNGTLFEIEPKVPYSTSYQTVVDQAKKEIKDGFRPEIKTSLPVNIDDYDVVFIGSPNWWGTVAPIVNSFLDKYDLSKKTIVPFITHGGGGEQQCVKDLESTISGANFLTPLILSGGIAKSDSGTKTINNWLKEIGY